MKLEKLLFIIGAIGFLTVTILIKDKNLSGSLAFIIGGGIHIICSNSLSIDYNKNRNFFAIKTSPLGLKIIGSGFILIGFLTLIFL